MSKRVLLTALSALTLQSAACAREKTAPAEIVATWTVDSTSALAIGRDAASDAGVSFERITGATRLPDGTLLVADLGDSPLRLFGSDGQFIRRVARKGGGPGEMEYLATMFRCGESIFVYDIDGYRVSEYGSDATYRRMFRFAVPPGQQVPYLSASSCSPTGRFVHLGWGNAPRVAGYHRDTVPVWVTASADGAPVLVDSVPSSERWGQTHQGRIVGSSPLPLGKQPSTAHGVASFVVATGDAYEVMVFDTTGARIGTYRLADTVATVTPADVRDFIEREIAENGEQNRASIEREYAEVTFPQRHGAITDLLVDADDLLWVRTYAPPSSEAVTWRVLSAAGREIAQVSLPRRLEVFEIGRDYVLGREIDAVEGVPVLRVLPLRRPAH